MKSPNWVPDEIILALDLYFKLESKEMHLKNNEVISLSNLLNKMPVHSLNTRKANFRNPSGVALKLSNFKSIDPNFDGKGMDRFSKLDEIVFEEFNNDRENLNKIASQIKKLV